MRAAIASAVAASAAGAAGPAACAAESGAPPQLACAASRSWAPAGTTVTLQAWAIDERGNPVGLPPGLRWQADRGVIADADAASARWVLPAAPGRRAALATLSGRDTRCEVRVWSSEYAVATPPGAMPGVIERGPLRARRFLTAGRDEPPGYGAYSYLLIPAPPRDEERERHVRVLMAYLRQLPEHAEIERYAPPAELNLFQLPLHHVPQLPLSPADAGDTALRAAAGRLLAAYDHARAQVLLSRLGVAATSNGPYLVTRAATGGTLRQDFGAVDPVVAEEWLQWATRIVTEPRHWSAETLSRAALSVRNVIAHAARMVPDIGSRAKEWVVIR